MTGGPILHVTVDGHMFDDSDSDLAGDGEFPPFRLFVANAQNYLSGTYTTREAAQAEADLINAGHYAV